MSKTKTHCRKVFKSDHLSSADLEEMQEEGRSLIFTIREVKAEFGVKVAGRKVDANIAYFVENIKPMVVNAGNTKILKKRTGSAWLEDWKNIPVELFVDYSKSFAGNVGGIAIKEQAPKIYTDKEIKVIVGKITASTSLEQLTEIFNSDVRVKTNREIMNALSERKKQLTE